MKIKGALLGLALLYGNCGVQQQCENPTQVRATTMVQSSVPVVRGEDFNRRILQNDGVTVVDFYAEWCGHCERFDPIYERVANAQSSHADFFKFNIDVDNDHQVDHPEIWNRYNLRGVPTVLVFRDGEMICRPRPSTDVAEFQRRLDDCLD